MINNIEDLFKALECLLTGQFPLEARELLLVKGDDILYIAFYLRRRGQNKYQPFEKDVALLFYEGVQHEEIPEVFEEGEGYTWVCF